MLGADPLDTPEPKACFARWLLAQTDRTDAIGALARSAAQDRSFPRDGPPDEVSCRLNAVGAEGNMHDALDDAALTWRSL